MFVSLAVNSIFVADVIETEGGGFIPGKSGQAFGTRKDVIGDAARIKVLAEDSVDVKIANYGDVGVAGAF